MVKGVDTLNKLIKECHKISEEHGFWDLKRIDPVDLLVATKIGLCMSELAEAMEAHRKGDWENFGEELADACIRIYDLAVAADIPLKECIVRKMAKNKDRPPMHGKRY
jgi:NTP pyrophosphatase (non-canonical NTP hydrolase)